MLSERYSSLSRYNGWDYDDFVTLAHIPIRSVDNFHTLASVLSQGTGQVNREGSLVNLLAAVRSVSGCGSRGGAANTESGNDCVVVYVASGRVRSLSQTSRFVIPLLFPGHCVTGIYTEDTW